MIVNIIDFLKERQLMVRRFFYIFIAAMIIWTIVGVDMHHAHTWMEAHIPGFWSLFGLVSCVVLIYFSRWFGKGGIKTEEDYYDN